MYVPGMTYTRALWARFAATMTEQTTADDHLAPRKVEDAHLKGRKSTVWITESFNPLTAETPRLERRQAPAAVTITHPFTITETVHITHSQILTSTHSFTITETIHVTDTQFATTTKNITHSKLIVVPSTITPSATVPRIAPELSPKSTSATPTPTLEAQHESGGLSKSALTAIGIAAFLGASLLFVAGWFVYRHWMKKYRGERVLRKQAQTEGNEMPQLPRYSGEPLPVAKRDSKGFWKSVV